MITEIPLKSKSSNKSQVNEMNQVNKRQVNEMNKNL